ncbi:MAG: diguanylate cyclase [Candidatus Lindowbacteria bacterium]|nr:diguanylate cyclase [Candidatus Lindowbacteria bacterium]
MVISTPLSLVGEATERPPTILVVDDEPSMRNNVKLALKHQDYCLFEACCGKDALKITHEQPVDLILLDLMMPDLDGFGVLTQLNHDTDAPFVLVISADSHLDTRAIAFEQGADDFIIKPYNTLELVARIRRLLARKKQLDEARTLSRFDSLTGLRNRYSFEKTIAAEVTRAKRFSHPLSLVYLDIDGLKQINDTFGHAIGDELLRTVAQVLLSTCRETDRPCRIGGDEFAAVLPETDQQKAADFLTRLNKKMSLSRYVAKETDLVPSVSVGLSVFPTDADNLSSLRRQADESLYRNKRIHKALRWIQ